ncbi:hypothetical protein BV20DRAFT_716413 [Pilatotrama ljubarskyi]|nr:hypothetical protein BV20DRAFT_716413 [Pilatotrama ljubarskyi]
MDSCPLELQMLIFSFACTDDGSAGRALSLVSRAFRQLSYPYQWYSLAIYGHAQATAFAKHLCSLPPALEFPRLISHLFVSSRSALEAVDHNTFELEPHRIWPGVLRSILRYAAPTLKTLAVICFEAPMDSAAILSQALRAHYPCLVELSIRGRCTPHQLSQPPPLLVEGGNDAQGTDDTDQDAMEVATWSAIPSLRRLHIACTFQGLARGTHAEHALVHELAPGLTHLRLSVLDLWGSKRMAEIVHAELAELGIVDTLLEVAPSQVLSPANAARRAPSAPSTFDRSSLSRMTHLTHPLAARSPPPAPGPLMHKASRVTWDRLIPRSSAFEMFAFQPAPTEMVDFYCSCCMDVRGDGDVMRVFEALSRASDERFLHLPCRAKYGYGFEEARTDWLERIEGSSGCWSPRQGVYGRPVAGGADGNSPLGEQTLDRPTSQTRKRGHAAGFKTAVKQLQKAKFW